MQKSNVLVLSGVVTKAKKEGFCYFKSDNPFIESLYVRYNPANTFVFDRLVNAMFTVGGVVNKDKFDRASQNFTADELLLTEPVTTAAAPGANK